MHPKPVDTSAKAHTLTEDYGREKKDSSEDNVSTICTEVCGSNLSGSKICLVSVFPSGQQEFTPLLLTKVTILLVRKKFFNVFDIGILGNIGESSSYYLKTCAGVSQ